MEDLWLEPIAETPFNVCKPNFALAFVELLVENVYSEVIQDFKIISNLSGAECICFKLP